MQTILQFSVFGVDLYLLLSCIGLFTTIIELVIIFMLVYKMYFSKNSNKYVELNEYSSGVYMLNGRRYDEKYVIHFLEKKNVILYHGLALKVITDETGKKTTNIEELMKNEYLFEQFLLLQDKNNKKQTLLENDSDIAFNLEAPEDLSKNILDGSYYTVDKFYVEPTFNVTSTDSQQETNTTLEDNSISNEEIKEEPIIEEPVNDKKKNKKKKGDKK